ncbi:hypothetical protein M0R45_012657 [Rubus argutus]|uniref:Enhancer of rudimentary homolog n=1 Tax=Rubus argutus TaxID=59490 RepID=A0AAW1YDA9_RUBAR
MLDLLFILRWNLVLGIPDCLSVIMEECVSGILGRIQWMLIIANKHTIILMQTSQNKATRTFMDYGSISQAMDGICGLYERKLRELNPAIRNISYDIGDLYNFIDGLADMSALVYDHSIQAYLPYDRQWIKQRTLRHLQKLAH